MKRPLSVLLLGACLAAGVAGCGDPIVVLGDLPGTMRLVAGVPSSPGSQLDSLASRSHLMLPRGLAVSEEGVLYVADTENGRVLELARTGGIRVIAGGPSCAGECPLEPAGLAMDDSGAVWIADPAAGRVFRWHSGTLSVRAGNGTVGDAPDGSLAVDAALNRPTGIAVAPSGVVFFTESGGHRVRRIGQDGSLTTVAGTGQSGYGGDGGPATAALLREPMGLATDGAALYIADSGNQRVRAVDLAGGVIRTVAGNGETGFGVSDSVASDALMNHPQAVAVTADGRSLFVADASNHRIRLVDLEADRISTFAGTGGTQTPAELQAAGETPLYLPGGVALFRSEILFVADTWHHVVWRTRISP